MHKFSLGLLALVGLFLSGCTLTPPKVGNGGNNTDGGRSPFQSGAVPGSIWRSSDGGQTFEPKVTVDEKRRITTADILDISFLTRDPQGEPNPKRAPSVFVATIDDGIFKSNDSGDSWEPRNFPPKKVYRFTADTVNPDRMFATGVVGGRGKIFRTKDGGATWQDVYTEPGAGTVLTSLVQAPNAPETIFAGTSVGTVVRSMDSGDTWKNIGTNIDGPITEIAFDATLPNRLYALAFEKEIYRSDDNGLTWMNPLQNGASGDGGVTPGNMIALIPDPSISGMLYTGTKMGFYRSKDAGQSWEKLNIIESAEQFSIRAFAINPKNSNEIVFVAGRTFYKSVNNGDTWTVIPLDVDREVSVIAYDPFDPSVLYLGLRKLK